MENTDIIALLHTLVVESIRNFKRGIQGHFRHFVRYKLDSPKEATTSDIPDIWMVRKPLSEQRFKVTPHATNILHKVLVLNDSLDF